MSRKSIILVFENFAFLLILVDAGILTAIGVVVLVFCALQEAKGGV